MMGTGRSYGTFQKIVGWLKERIICPCGEKSQVGRQKEDPDRESLTSEFPNFKIFSLSLFKPACFKREKKFFKRQLDYVAQAEFQLPGSREPQPQPPENTPRPALFF